MDSFFYQTNFGAQAMAVAVDRAGGARWGAGFEWIPWIIAGLHLIAQTRCRSLDGHGRFGLMAPDTAVSGEARLASGREDRRRARLRAIAAGVVWLSAILSFDSLQERALQASDQANA